MMAKNGESESCEVAKNLAALDSRVDGLEKRMDKIEGSLSIGFTQVNTAIGNLAQQFGDRMNTLDRRIVEEKAKENERKAAERTKWGDCLRGIVTLVARLLVVGCGVAMGVTAWKMIFGN